MFERYTPDTRKALFLARQEALALDRPSIETEPLLIGVLRACPEIAREHLKLESSELLVRLGRDPLAESANPLPSSPSRSSGLKLSQSTKRVLAFAAEESDRMKDRHIRPEHLLLGIMREEQCDGAKLLRSISAPPLHEVRNSIIKAARKSA